MTEVLLVANSSASGAAAAGAASATVAASAARAILASIYAASPIAPASRARPRCRRLITVPTGMPSALAACA